MTEEEINKAVIAHTVPSIFCYCKSKGRIACKQHRAITELVRSCVRSAEQAPVERERAACIEAANGERVSDETGDEGDGAYNNAIDHVIIAIRARNEGNKEDE